MCTGWHIQDVFNYFLMYFFFIYFMVSCHRCLLYMVSVCFISYKGGGCSELTKGLVGTVTVVGGVRMGCHLGCTLGTSLVVMLVSLTVGATVLLGIVVLHLTSQANVPGICFP